MKIGSLLLLLISCAIAYGGSSTIRSKEEIVRWYGEYREAIRFVGYQGSDEKQHHFIARVMDDWAFLQIERDKLKLIDERPFQKRSDSPLYFYLVDPSRNFDKIEPEKEANQPVETTAAPLPFSSFATSANLPLNHVLAHPRLT